MTQLKKQIIAVLATGSLGLYGVAPVFAATTLTITGNGSNSTSNVTMETSNTTTVVQSNNAVVSNAVTSNATTGGNTANDNTGGDVVIKTGNAKSISSVENTLNSNMAKVDCCNTGDVKVEISGNGTQSKNTVNLTQEEGQTTSVFQTNKADVKNVVSGAADSGSNEANRNTGGDVTIKTGDATATSGVSTTANVNKATIGGAGQGGTGGVSAIISGNGSSTTNEIDLDLTKSTTIIQSNIAAVLNAVTASAKTGNNTADDNTGGDVVIWTGNANAEAKVNNKVNFNSADIDCGCLLDATAKVAGNGTGSLNTISASLGEDREVFQGDREGSGNFALLTNVVDPSSNTGTNTAKFDSGAVSNTDPFITTGNSTSKSSVDNTGNVNVYGKSLLGLSFPNVDVNFNVTIPWSQLMALLGR